MAHISGNFPQGKDALSALVSTNDVTTETYMGETYRLERRDIWSLIEGRDRKVWCWEVLSGPAEGNYGGKCGTKSEARKWAKNEIKAWAEETVRANA